jgi:hypothetical protein
MAFARTAFAGFHYGSGAGPYDAASRRAALDRLDMLATAFDTAFIVPGTNVRFGVESLLRLVPGVFLLIVRGVAARRAAASFGAHGRQCGA